MTQTPNAPLAALLDVAKLKAIKQGLGGTRVLIDSTADQTAAEIANALLESAASTTENFFGLALLVSEGIEDAERICIATLGVRDKETKTDGIKAICAFPLPSVADFLSDPAAESFIAKLIEREAADVAFGNLRGDKTMAELKTAFAGLPRTVAEIISTSRESGTGLDTDAFDTMWNAFRTGFLKVKMPSLAAALPQKAEVIKAIRSASYALANPDTKAIEERKAFVGIAATMVKMAPAFMDKDGKPAPVDASAIQDWIDNRDTVHIGYKAATKAELAAEEVFDFDH